MAPSSALSALQFALTAFITAFRSCAALVDFSTCTFESDMCGWRSTKGSGDFQWQRGSSQLNTFLVDNDHTFGSSIAQYMFVDGLSNIDNGWSVLESVQVTPSDDVCAVKFAYHYHIFGHLTVEMDHKILKTLATTGSGEWVVDIVFLDVSMPSVVQLVVTWSTTDSYVEVGLDDIQFIPCTLCTFESGLCRWTSTLFSSSSLLTEWKQHSGATPSPSTGPGVDNTLGSSRGHYVYVEATNFDGYTAVLRGQDFSYDDNICSVAFCYHMYGEDAGTLMVNSKSSDGVVQNRWKESGNQGNKWRCIERRVFDWDSHMKRSNFTMQVEFNATVGSDFRSDIALDDIQYHYCAVTDECTFTLDTCVWNNALNNKLQWQLKRLPGMVSGNVLVANVSYPKTPSADNVGAHLVGSIIDKRDNFCSLRISYSYALSQSMLLLQQSFVDLPQLPFLLKHLSRHLVRYTLETSLPQLHHTLNSISISYISIRATWNSSELGEFFIHSLQYLRCHYTTFERDIYPWSSLNARWSLVFAPDNVTSSVVPPVDRTYGGSQQGRYFLATGTQNAVASVFNIPWKDVCGLRLWYYVSQGLPTLRVVVFNKTSTNDSSVVASVRQSGITAEWTLLEMAVGSQLYGSGIELIAFSTDGAPFSVGVDDIEFTECADFQSCSFEKNLCLWRVADDLSVGASWIRWRGPHPTINSTLLSDHTRKTPLGHYLLMIHAQTYSASSSEWSAFLQGLPLSGESGVCGIEFWYHVVTIPSVTITVTLVSESDKRIVWQYCSPNNGTMTWLRARVEFKLNDMSHVQFAARSRGHNATAVALDDLTYLRCTDHGNFTEGETVNGCPSSSPSSSTTAIPTCASYSHVSHETSSTVRVATREAQPTQSASSRQTHLTVQPTKKQTHPPSAIRTSELPTGHIHESASGGVSTAAISVGAAGGIAFIVMIFVVIFVFYRRSLRRRSRHKSDESVAMNSYVPVQMTREKSEESLLEPTEQDPVYEEVAGVPSVKVDGMSPNPLYRDPSASFASVSDENKYSTIGQGSRSVSSRHSENVLYQSCEERQSHRYSQSSENILYESASDNATQLLGEDTTLPGETADS